MIMIAAPMGRMKAGRSGGMMTMIRKMFKIRKMMISQMDQGSNMSVRKVGNERKVGRGCGAMVMVMWTGNNNRANTRR